jgi:asparaginyl-tRNA synthetase
MLKTHTLIDIQNHYPTLIGDTIQYYGWVRRIRIGSNGSNGSIIFIDIYDGTHVGALMCIALEDIYDGDNKILFNQLSKSEFISDGCAVEVIGKLVQPSGNAIQKYELQIERLQVIGSVEDPATYPIQKSTDKLLSALRKLPFMRFRSQIMQSLLRISSKLELAVHIFMDNYTVEKIDPNIITISDCEGAGETFMVSPPMFSKDEEGKEIPVGLTVSSQLPLEAAICGFRHVYTCQKSFRAEKSDTNKHLAEFLHVEYEAAFITFDELLDFTEKFVKFSIKYVLERCFADFNFMESKLAPNDLKPTRQLLNSLLSFDFVRIKHVDAINLINKIVKDKMMLPDDNGVLKRVKIDKLPQHGQDLTAEHEKILVKYFGFQNKVEGAFVFVTHWPLKIKSFYMKQSDDFDETGECESFDLLAPRVGEMFGGSMREWRYDKLMNEIMRREMDITPIKWFADLRKNGSAPHGGWGMGFARFVMLLTGVQSVRDIVPFPVYYGYCPY